MQGAFLDLSHRSWGLHFWGRGTLVNVTYAMLNAYIANDVDSRKSENATTISLE